MFTHRTYVIFYIFFNLHRSIQQERIKELQQKERQRQILKQKKQGLNELWLSKKAVVTVDDNSDYHDEDLLNTSTEQLATPSLVSVFLSQSSSRVLRRF